MKVKLAADCYVDKEIRKAGEIVDLPEEIAKDFGEVQEEKPKNEDKAKK